MSVAQPSLGDDSLMLLPAGDEAPRCADFTRALAVDPGGTAISATVLVLVEVPLPWPKPVFDREGFEDVLKWVRVAADQGRPVRVLAAVPLDDIADARVVVHRRPRVGAPRFDRVEHHVAPHDVPELLRTLLTAGPEASTATEIAVGELAEELLICTQGMPVRTDTTPQAMAMPAEGPSLGMAPAGKCTW